MGLRRAEQRREGHLIVIARLLCGRNSTSVAYVARDGELIFFERCRTRSILRRDEPPDPGVCRSVTAGLASIMSRKWSKVSDPVGSVAERFGLRGLAPWDRTLGPVLGTEPPFRAVRGGSRVGPRS